MAVDSAQPRNRVYNYIPMSVHIHMYVQLLYYLARSSSSHLSLQSPDLSILSVIHITMTLRS
jgi:hypothetical protein